MSVNACLRVCVSFSDWIFFVLLLLSKTDFSLAIARALSYFFDARHISCSFVAHMCELQLQLQQPFQRAYPWQYSLIDLPFCLCVSDAAVEAVESLTE